MHEAGHGLYAHGIAPSLERTPLASAPSLGLNESQSRTWENLVGRSRPFWTHWYEPLQATFPDQLGSVGLDDFVAAINRAEPGLIRVDADETTYSLHIILRFDLERQLIEGTAGAEGRARKRGTRAMRELLGVDVPNDAKGVLQDVHWSSRRHRLLPDLRARQRDLAADLVGRPRGDPRPRRAAGGRRARAGSPTWLRDNLYSLGRKLTPEGDDRAAHGLPDDRPAAVPRVPAREARGATCRPRSSSQGFARAGSIAADASLTLTLVVNGEPRSLEVEPRTLLVHALRDGLGLTGTHVGCDTSQCGACTVLLDGRAVKSCTVLALQAEGAEVTTIEGLAPDGELHPIQRAFVEHHGLQCGFCTPGMILTAVDLLSRDPDPTTRRSVARCAGTSAAARGTSRSSRRSVAARRRRCDDPRSRPVRRAPVDLDEALDAAGRAGREGARGRPVARLRS